MFGVFVQTIFVLVILVPIIYYINILSHLAQSWIFRSFSLFFYLDPTVRAKVEQQQPIMDFQNGVIVEFYKS